MKSRFFKKSSSKNENIPQSTSYDSQLDQLQRPSLNIKQRKNPPINPNSLETIQRKSASFTQKVCCPTPSSSSSTQGIIGCTNGLFECCNNTPTSLFPTEMQLIAEGKRAYFGRIRKHLGEPAESLINYSPVLSHKQHLIDQQTLNRPTGQQYGVNTENTPNNTSNNSNNNQIAQLVFTLAQQLNLKDLEINKLKNKLKRIENRDEKIFEKLNNELEIKENEIKENKEEIKRIRRKLKNVEIELNIASNNNFKINIERDKTMDEMKLYDGV
ncbi:hypothetical protein ACQ4LE_008020 [Meloidogyne hapla]